MSLELEQLGQTAANLMDTLEADEDLPEGAVLEEVMVIAAVTWPANDGCGNYVYYACTSGRPWVQRGLLEQTHGAVLKNSRPFDPDEDE